MELKETFFKTKILSLFFSRAAWQQFHFSCGQYVINSALRRSWCDCVVVDDHHALMRSSRGNELGVTAQVPVSRFVTHHHVISLIHSVAAFPPVNASFLFSVTERRLGERKKKAERKKSRSASLFPPPLLPQLFTVNLRENKRSVSPVHSSALPFHPLTSLHSHIRFIPPFSQGYMCAHEHAWDQKSRVHF